ncbi:hypothetical protein PAMA111031_09380 [Paraphotobacterium marinum]
MKKRILNKIFKNKMKISQNKLFLSEHMKKDIGLY